MNCCDACGQGGRALKHVDGRWLCERCRRSHARRGATDGERQVGLGAFGGEGA